VCVVETCCKRLIKMKVVEYLKEKIKNKTKHVKMS
jgi:hypothetical protein